MYSVINVGSSTLKVAARLLSQLCAVVLGDSVCCGCRHILELGIPKNRKNKQTPEFHFMNQTNEQNSQKRKKLQSEFSCQGLMALSLSFVVVPNKLNILKAQGH